MDAEFSLSKLTFDHDTKPLFSLALFLQGRQFYSILRKILANSDSLGILFLVTTQLQEKASQSLKSEWPKEGAFRSAYDSLIVMIVYWLLFWMSTLLKDVIQDDHRELLNAILDDP